MTVPELLEALTDEDARVREVAVQNLRTWLLGAGDRHRRVNIEGHATLDTTE